MSQSLVDLFKSETEIEIKASELFGIMKEASKAELMLNAANCEVPHKYIREIMTGEREPVALTGIIQEFEKGGSVKDTEQEKDEPETDVRQQDRKDGLTIIRRSTQGAEWIDIQDIIRKGRAPISIPVGTEIEFELKNGELAVVAVAALNHYGERDAVFHFRRIIGRHCMNKKNTNAGGWHDSEMRRYLNEDVFALLPDGLQDVIAEHEGVQRVGEMNVESVDRLFLPSECEVGGVNDYAENNGVDMQIPLFAERINRIVADGDGDPVFWWLADPSASDATAFCYFANAGGSLTAGASGELGVAPLFVIK